ncbi:MAG TPA: ribosome silencing factor [Cytophagales bacterium]|nr:ribosome silencing factor [Cytophagales bacterium]HAA19426.1 ribosome silencing factor [Cytophagales bacterium]HAP63360.1 ribosome silencing factor [Cytophagales bacterium]
MTAEDLSKLVVHGMQEKKAQDIVILDLRNVKNAVADFFVLASGSSDTQVDSIADSVEKELSEQANENVWHKEGKTNREWILLDYVNVVAHIFKKETREFYGLEELWGDAKVIAVEPEG